MCEFMCVCVCVFKLMGERMYLGVYMFVLNENSANVCANACVCVSVFMSVQLYVCV